MRTLQCFPWRALLSADAQGLQLRRRLRGCQSTWGLERECRQEQPVCCNCQKHQSQRPELVRWKGRCTATLMRSLLDTWSADGMGTRCEWVFIWWDINGGRMTISWNIQPAMSENEMYPKHGTSDKANHCEPMDPSVHRNCWTRAE